MFLRIARFEGVDPTTIDTQVAELRKQLGVARAGRVPPGIPTEAADGLRGVTRVMEIADRDAGATAGLVFCKTEDDLRRADAALDRLSPGEGAGRRTSVEMFEVVLDEPMASR